MCFSYNRRIILNLFIFIQVIALFACIAVAAAASVPAPPGADATAETLKSDSAVNPDSFQYNYETSNGIRAQESGQLKQIGEESGIVQQGDFSYKTPDGQEIKVTYIADENGFQASIFEKKKRATIHSMNLYNELKHFFLYF